MAKGWPIGSGPVESACKTVIGQRMKGAGMRWGEQGSDGVCHLRALFLSETGPMGCILGQTGTGGVAVLPTSKMPTPKAGDSAGSFL